MMSRRVFLRDIQHAMLIIEHAPGVRYQNQVGGTTCWQEELEGVLCPIDIGHDQLRQIERLPYPQGHEGISSAIADFIDEVLASKRSTSFVKVDRTRLGDSWEAWVYVLIESPDEAGLVVGHQVETATEASPGTYVGPLEGFGRVKGVLTWENSD